MCKKSGESVDHLLLHCSLACDLWSMVFGLYGVQWILLRRVLDLLTGWLGNLSRHRSFVVWRAVPHCVMWCLWREQNAPHFEDCEKTIPVLKLLFFQNLYDWVVGLGLFSLHYLEELIDLCTLLILFGP